MAAAYGLQKQNRKHISFKEAAGAGSVGSLGATSPAVEFFEKKAPRGTTKGSHGVSPGNCSTLIEMPSCGPGARSLFPHILEEGACTCKGPLRHGKVRRLC